jgi:hypothetical protein
MRSGIFLIRYAFLLFLFSLSCNKEADDGLTPPFTMTGEWVFMSNTVSTECITTYTVDGIVYKNRTTSDYVTYNNEGAVSITGDNNIEGKDLRFDVITKLFFSFYIGDDEEEDSVEVPFTYYMDTVYTVRKAFQLIGQDSIYFPDGIIMQIPDMSGQERTSMALPQRGTVKRLNRAMKIITSSTDEYSYDEDGITFHVAKKERVETDFARQF